MASYQVIISLFFTLVLARAEFSTGHVLEGSVTCLDCDGHNDLSGIKVLVKCSNVKKMALATTKEDGTFSTELPKDTRKTSPADSPKCLAKILGAPTLLYTSGKKTISKVEKVQGHDYYANSQPLNFYNSCPPEKHAQCASTEFSSSKTVDIPLPREWGLAPSSYYFPFFPIIGIP
ncbi:hypothetical protein ACH5RR_021152 [Cinchona calisaya]|uniref:Pollen Ole e 1 allergen and extensin family protein n=1 Tax=Cinchona calisaya TaxID=153742 RepID=A0ABD2ZGP1_9GENT